MRAALLLAAAAADFVFVDFNETQGLRLNGAAATSACEEVEARSHGPHETNLGEGSLDEVYGENDDVMKTVRSAARIVNCSASSRVGSAPTAPVLRISSPSAMLHFTCHSYVAFLPPANRSMALPW